MVMILSAPESGSSAMASRRSSLVESVCARWTVYIRNVKAKGRKALLRRPVKQRLLGYLQNLRLNKRRGRFRGNVELNRAGRSA
jgi:hypothetical protein